MLADGERGLQLVASTSEKAALVELLQTAGREGPCLDAFRTGRSVTVADLESDSGRWLTFSREALRLGYRSIHATPSGCAGRSSAR